MSEEKQIEKPEVKEEPKVDDIVGDNVALLKSKVIARDALIVELTDKLETLNTKYEQAKEFIDQEAKGDLIAYISPRYDLADEYLMLKTKDQLKAIKAIIDKVEPQAFKSGTKMDTKKTSQKALLDTTFDRAQAKRLGGNK